MTTNFPIPDQQLSFEDMDLNSSVERRDGERLSRQAGEMLRLFLSARRRGEEVSNLQLRAIGSQQNARLYEVRRHLIKRGFCIDLVYKGKGGLNWYGICPLGRSEFYRRRRDRLEAEGGYRPW